MKKHRYTKKGKITNKETKIMEKELDVDEIERVEKKEKKLSCACINTKTKKKIRRLKKKPIRNIKKKVKKDKPKN